MRGLPSPDTYRPRLCLALLGWRCPGFLSSFLQLWQLPRAQAVDLSLDLLSRSGTTAGASQHQGTAASSEEHLREPGLLLAWVGSPPALPHDFRQMIYLVVNNVCSCPPAIRADEFTSCPPHSVRFSRTLHADEPRATATADSVVASLTRSRRQAGEPCQGPSDSGSRLVSINSITLCMESRGVQTQGSFS